MTAGWGVSAAVLAPAGGQVPARAAAVAAVGQTKHVALDAAPVAAERPAVTPHASPRPSVVEPPLPVVEHAAPLRAEPGRAAGSQAASAPVEVASPSATPTLFTDDQPGRVEQLPGQAGYALTLPLGSTLTTTITTPSLECTQVPPQYNQVVTGVQLTLEVSGVYLYEQSLCHRTSHFGVGTGFVETDTAGATATFTETVDATKVVATMDIPAQRNAAGYNNTWVFPGTFTGGSAFVGVLDEEYDAAGAIPPYTQIPFNDTEVTGIGLGAFIEANPSTHAAEQNSVFGGRLQDQTSYIASGSSFTMSNANLGLPFATMNNPTVLQPATGTTTVDVTVTLSQASAYPVYISFAVGGTVVRFDYTAGTLTFTPGVTTQEIPITVLTGEGGGDTTFDMYLLNPSYATTQSKPAVVTIEAVDVDQVAPNDGLVQGGNQIMVTGDNFTGATAVVFTPLGGTPVDATDYTVDSDGTITVTVPDLSDQLAEDQTSMLVDIQVQVDRAESPRGPSDNYTAVELAVSGVNPNTGPLAGGTAVSITGSGFTWATDVVFTLSDGQQFTIPLTPADDDGPLQVESPAIPGSAVKHDQAVANVQVDADDQGVEATSPDTTADHFTYQGPVVRSVQPSTGPLAGGTQITITGNDFTGGTAVVFVFANGTKTTVKATPGSSTSVSVTAPAASASALATNQALTNVEVRVTTDGSSATSPANGSDLFTYKGPRVTALSQTNGPLAGGTTLTVTGTGFTGATAVLFHFANGGVLSVPGAATSNTSITVKTPAVSAAELSTDDAVADVEVQVQGAGATTATSPATAADTFTFQGPTVASVSPLSGPAQGGTSITVSGHGFTGATAVLFHFGNGSVQSVTASATSDTSLTVTTPQITASVLSNDQAIADVEVEVSAGGDTTATSPASALDHYTYQGPKVTKVSPSSGPVQGGTTVTISGSNLSGASEVELVAPDNTEYDAIARTVTASSVKVTTPALPATELTANAITLEVAVEVPLADGSVAITPASSAKFTMKGPAVSKLSPATGLEGTTVKVAGSNLTGADQVTFTVAGVTYTAAPTSVTATSLSVVSPNIPAAAMASGLAKATVQVDVPLPGSTTASSPVSKTGVFSYEAPTVTSVAPSSAPVAGGNKVTVKGKNLSKASMVTLTIGTTVLSVKPSTTAAKSLAFTAPAVPASLVGTSGAKATVQVDVPAPSGVTLVSAATTKGHYTYRNPAVTKLSPTSGPSTGGTTVTVTGTNLTGANEVLVTVGKTVLTVTPTSATAASVKFTTPAIASGLLKGGKAVASVQVGVPGAGGSEAMSAVVAASHFTYVSGA